MNFIQNKTKKVALLICIAWLASVQIFAQTNVSGLISTNTVWTVANSPYVVIGNVLVNNGVTLTIEPGVMVKFNSGLSLQIDGTLIAQGTISDSITFTSNTLDTAGAWGYIYFSDTSIDAVFQTDINGTYISGSILEYCNIQYAGGVSVSENGALRFDGAHPFVNHCTVRDNSATGIHAYNNTSMLKISNSLIINNISTYTGPSSNGGGIYISGDGNNLITGNTISNNTASSGGGINVDPAGGTYVITNNVISHNTGISTGGGIDGSAMSIYNNIIMNNTTNIPNTGCEGGALYVTFSTVSENIIINNSAGRHAGAVFNGGTTLYNVIADNTANGDGGALYTYGAILNNHIVRNTSVDGSAIYRWITTGNQDIIYNTIVGNRNTDLNNQQNASLYILDNLDINNNNIFNNSTFYELYNSNAQGSPNLAATNNWWGTTIDAEIQTKIYDWFDNNSLGIVNYSPYLSKPDTIAPVSPPANVTKTNIGGGQVLITWEHNPETDIAGYHLCYGGFTGYSFTDSVDVGNDTSYILTGISVFDTIAVTAYDSAYSIANEDVSTITNDNMTNGNESWYTYAESECSTITLAMSAVDASCSTCSDGTATATVSLGLAPYTYSWNTAPVQTTATATGLLPETYMVTITDNNGCVLADSVVVSFNTNINEEVDPSLVSVFPNPANESVIIDFATSSNDYPLAGIYSIDGRLLQLINIKQKQTEINISDLPAGVYMIKVTGKNAVSVKMLVKE
ncbi:MAG: T9SS type A sorting domain-containing protein [Bacteroidota bacterium]